MKRILAIMLVLVSIFIFTGCQKDEEIYLNGDTVVEVGQYITLSTNKQNEELIWTAIDNNILYVVDGKVYGVSVGETTVIVYLKKNEKLYAEITIEVIMPEGVKEVANSINDYFQNVFPDIAEKRVILPYSEEIEVIQSIVYPDSVKRMRPGEGKVGRKMPGGVKYIVIHDTGMAGANYNAEGINEYIHEQANSPDGRVASWHYTVGDDAIYQHVPDDEVAWHAGDGSQPYGSTYYNETYKSWSIGGGNLNGIGIETCINQGGNYQLTLRKTAKLVATLLDKHNLELDAVKQHYNFSGKNCPAVIRSIDGRWEDFLKEVEFHLNVIRSDGDVEFNWEIDKTNVIDYDGLVNGELINDELVNIKLKLKINNVESEYIYTVKTLGMDDEDKLFHLYLYMNDNLIPKDISSSIELPITNDLYNASLEWASSHPNILSATGDYSKPQSPTLVTLTVKMKTNDTSLEKIYRVTVR